MAVARDIMLDDNNALRIEGGDYVVDLSDGQHVKLMLYSNPGSWRQNPLVGIGVRRLINKKMSALELLSFKKEITVQLTGDGVRVNGLVITPSKLKIDSERI